MQKAVCFHNGNIWIQNPFFFFCHNNLKRVTRYSLTLGLEFVQRLCRLSARDKRALLCGTGVKGICSSAQDLQGSSNTFEHYIQQKSPLIHFAVFLCSNEGNPLCTRQVFFLLTHQLGRNRTPLSNMWLTMWLWLQIFFFNYFHCFLPSCCSVLQF